MPGKADLGTAHSTIYDTEPRYSLPLQLLLKKLPDFPSLNNLINDFTHKYVLIRKS